MANEGMSPIEAALIAVMDMQISLMGAEHPSAANLTRGLDAAVALHEFLMSLRRLESLAANSSTAESELARLWEKRCQDAEDEIEFEHSRAERAETERDRLQAELVAYFGDRPIPARIAAALDNFDRDDSKRGTDWGIDWGDGTAIKPTLGPNAPDTPR
jgi:hypothetical protein